MSHVSYGQLVRLLGTRKASGLDQEEVACHVAGCPRCWRVAQHAFDHLEATGTRGWAKSEPTKSLITLIRAQRERNLAHIGATGRLAKLKRLRPAKRLDLIKTTAVYRTLAMVEAVIRETEALARSRSDDAEEFGRLALQIIDALSPDACPEPMKNDLRSNTWVEVANGRRLRADWQNAQQAQKLAGSLLLAGTGDPLHAARLHSFRSALAFDIGQMAVAVKEASAAQGIYREYENWAGLARTMLQEASALVETEPDRALALCEQGVEALKEDEPRLLLYLKNAATQCLVRLGRTGEALHLHAECRQLLEQFPGETGLEYIILATEARLLEAQGSLQEAELLYRDVVESSIDEGLLKENFISRLMLYSFYVQRDRLEEAAVVCVEACRALDEAKAHPQMRSVWNDLKALTLERQVDSALIKSMTIYMVGHWHVPARQVPLPARS